MKKVLLIGIPLIAILMSFIFLYFSESSTSEFKPNDNEIALEIQLNTKENIGLLVFDYSANGLPQSGGISNADHSPLHHDDRLIQVWNQEDLESSSDRVNLSIQFRIITEYVEPNFANEYPTDLTKFLEPISLEAHWGEIYSLTITGDRTNGYEIIQN